MESNFSNREFEQFVKQNADQYRMFPSERVWNGINNTLHTRRKWYGIWLTVLLLATGGAVTWVMTAYPPTKKQLQGLSENSVLPASPVTGSAPFTASIEDLLSFHQPSSRQTTATASSIIAEPGGFFIHVDEEVPGFNSFQPVETGAQDDFPVITARQTPAAIFSMPALADATDMNESGLAEPERSRVTSQVETSRKKEAILFPMTIESIVNAYRHQKPVKKISWQLFVTPTVSYRRLSINKSFDNPTAGVFPFAYLSDVNSAVTHKPDLGLQIGVSAHYPIARNLKLRAGLQFNINRYDIKAYQFNGEVATIDLNGGGPGNNTISTWTYYRNFAGYKSDWLKNYYFSVSAPIGAEVKLLGNDKTSIGIAGTLQPTYVLNDRAYLISTDFKNYAEVPRLIRHVNLNTSFETFVNYTSGKTKWQVGPQVRYQILSSFQNTYPVKENLFDFGLKVGVTLNE